MAGVEQSNYNRKTHHWEANYKNPAKLSGKQGTYKTTTHHNHKLWAKKKR